jgi:NADPH:quinone reductase-like Zn-dependent oxidoreductase
MKAIILTKYGAPDILQFKEVEKPAPKENEVLVKVQAASLNALDWHLMRGKPYLLRMSGNGFLKPKDQRLGVDLAGRVEAVGTSVTQFQPGDEVFGRGLGAFAEYVCPREDALVLKPVNLSFEAAAAIPVAALTALQGLRDKGRLQSGQKVLINGASGGVGSFAVQLAKALGAEVTAVCSPQNLDTARQIGADHLIDYTKEDFTKNGQRYDLILSVNGYHPLSAYRRALNPNGIYVMVGASNAHLYQAMFQSMVLGPLLSRIGKQKTGFFIMNLPQADLAFIKELVEAGKVVSVIDRCYPLSEVAEAIRYLEEGHAKGKVVITV